ncbi:SHOCT domain-containing protein [Aneurinibacillus terranovensis]|uniref:SHOCT domain-containing protein n=1 Tax=Aneurinibacillus terranovensis TaxID=278991 RepID=UPI00047F27B7|nr:hypothetical protein [Aneurinibacillus terranovensis]
MMNSMLGFGSVGMFVWMLLRWIILLTGIYVMIRLIRGEGKVKQDDTAINVVRERYARGEITENEYFKISNKLQHK